jgi:diphthamide biosynthesis protein 7
MKWIHQPLNGLPHLSIVTSTGQLILLRVLNGSFQEVLLYQGNESTLLLSLDWSNRILKNCPERCITSSSSGVLSLFNLENLEIIREFNAHSFEAWISAFDYWDPNIVYSGGDDGLFKGWDMNSGKNTFIKKFDAGVTSISSHPLREYILASGRYILNW